MSTAEQAEYAHRSYLKHRATVLARSRQSYATNKVAIDERHRQWDADHREWKRAAYMRWYEAAKGPLTRAEWNEILDAYQHRCAYCGVDGKLQKDHMVPLSRGGSHDRANVVPACPSCNRKKHNKTPKEWLGECLAS